MLLRPSTNTLDCRISPSLTNYLESSMDPVHLISPIMSEFDANSSTISILPVEDKINHRLNKEDAGHRMRLGDTQRCKGCGLEIKDRYYLRVFDQFWHEHCLRCSSCEKSLSESSTCYFKRDRVYCKEDHKMLFAPKCAGCQVELKPTDCVYRCQQFTFHAGCFQCTYCKRELQQGDHYYCIEGQLVCQSDYLQFFVASSPYCYPPMMLGASLVNEMPYSQPVHSSHQIYYETPQPTHSRDKKQAKRPRTILNAAQRKSFKIAFEKSPKPSRKVREQLARDTGLSVRVVQVWMQNQRAKLKKEQRKRDTGSVKSNSITGSNSTDSDLKSIAEDEVKSVGDLDDECDSEEYVESGRSSTINNQPITTNTLPNLTGTPEFLPTIMETHQSDKFSTPIDKLYQMHNTYFALV